MTHSCVKVTLTMVSRGPDDVQLGLGWIFQDVPFQCSISVRAGLRADPTAHAFDRDVAATACSLLPVPTLGLLTSAQVLPFQRSMSVSVTTPLP